MKAINEILKQFDEKFNECKYLDESYRVFYPQSNGSGIMVYENNREKIKSFIRQVRQDDIKSLIEWAENMKRVPMKVLESQGIKDSQGYDHAFREIIFYLKSQL